jgi:hypothetical protein
VRARSSERFRDLTLGTAAISACPAVEIDVMDASPGGLSAPHVAAGNPIQQGQSALFCSGDGINRLGIRLKVEDGSAGFRRQGTRSAARR